MRETTEYKENLYKKYENFRLEDDDEKRREFQKEIQSILDDLEYPDSEDIYILGLSFYFLNEEEQYNTVLALELFLKAYQLDSNNFLACLYAAHCFQDKDEFKEALELYEKVNQQELKKFQIWRYIKLIEQIGFCHFKLGREEVGREKFRAVLEWYKVSETDEVPFPVEMMKCLDSSDCIIREMENFL